MTASPDKFQAIIMKKRRENQITHQLKIFNNETETTKSVKLVGIEIDNQLSFNQHTSKLCSKAAMQLNAICRLAKFIGNKEKIATINSFVYSNFNYCPLVWHFCSCESSKKIEKIQKHYLRLVLDDYKSDYGNLKLTITIHKDNNTLNKRTKVISKCWHRNKYIVANYDSKD